MYVVKMEQLKKYLAAFLVELLMELMAALFIEIVEYILKHTWWKICWAILFLLVLTVCLGIPWGILTYELSLLRNVSEHCCKKKLKYLAFDFPYDFFHEELLDMIPTTRNYQKKVQILSSILVSMSFKTFPRVSS